MPTSEDSAKPLENTERANRILDAAAKLMLHFGFDKTTMSDIASEAGVSKGALYLHWKSKEAMLEALVYREIWRYADMFLSKMLADPEGGTFLSMYKHSLTALKENPFMQALMNKDRRVLGEFARKDHNKLLRKRNFVSQEFIKLMQEAGAMRADYNPEVVAYILSAFSYGIISMDQVIPIDEAPPLEETLEVLIVMLDRALTPEGGGSSEAGKQIMAQMVQLMKTQMQP